MRAVASRSFGNGVVGDERNGQSETKESKVAVGAIERVPGPQFKETLVSVSPDVPREMIREFVQRMMDAEVEVRCNLGHPGRDDRAGDPPAEGPGYYSARTCT